MVKRIGALGVVLLAMAIVAAAVAWMAAAMDYGESAAIGTYRFDQQGVVSVLVLNADHTFGQELTSLGKTNTSQGTWRHLGEGGVSFSKEFLPVPGEEVEPDGTTFADIHKTLGLSVRLEVRQYHVLWYEKTGESNENSLAGTYVGHEEGVPATLIVNADNSFEQVVVVGGVPHQVNGKWAIGKKGEIVFSKAFLKMSGESLRENESAVDENPRGTSLQIEIAASSKNGVPTFHKKIL